MWMISNTVVGYVIYITTFNMCVDGHDQCFTLWVKVEEQVIVYRIMQMCSNLVFQGGTNILLFNRKIAAVRCSNWQYISAYLPSSSLPFILLTNRTMPYLCNMKKILRLYQIIEVNISPDIDTIACWLILLLIEQDTILWSSPPRQALHETGGPEN